MCVLEVINVERKKEERVVGEIGKR